ncbi:MAG: hypothetical protein IJH54_08095 [Clostridia bacterium]|nr:hypothetical protein [Clostridia bacterium]
MKKQVFAFAICLCLLLACTQVPKTAVAQPTAAPTDAPTLEPTPTATPTPIPTATPEPTPTPTPEPVLVNGQLFAADTEDAVLDGEIAYPDAIRDGLRALPGLKAVTLKRTVPEKDLAPWVQAWAALAAEFPAVAFTFQDLYHGAPADAVTDFVPQALPAGELEAILSIFPNLASLDLTGLPLERAAVAQALTLAPDLSVRWLDETFGPSDSAAAALTFAEPVTAADVRAYLPCFPQLQEVDLLAAGLTEAEGDALCAAFPNLAFRRMVTLNGETLDSFTEELDLSRAQIPDAAAFSDALGCFPKLKRLEMHFCSLSNEELAAIRDRYPATKVVWTVKFNKWKVRTDAVAFSTLQLAPNDNRLRSEHAQVLQYCTDLVALDLGHNNIIDIEWLRPLKKLQVLILADNSKLQNIEAIGTLTKLKYIELFMTSVDDITPLGNLSDLLDVNLCFTKITDITPLLNCKKLERIWFGKDVTAQIGEEGLATLQAAFPDAQYDLVSRSSTYMGWREHPRYHAYIQMFRTNTAVEPFVPED